MRRLTFSILALAALLPLAATADPARAEDRYVSPSGTFTISLDSFGDRKVRAGDETANAAMVVVDFPFLNSMGLPLPWRRTVEWIRLDKPIDPSQYDQQATEAVAGYLEGRFNGQLTVADRGKFRDGDGRLVYAFAAQGMVNQTPAQWQGAVIFFASGVALVSELTTAPADHPFAAKNGVVSQAAIDWAQTLQPAR